MKEIYLHLFAFCLVVWFCSSCSKEDNFLNAKPSQNLTVPRTLADLADLIANENIFNRNYPSLSEVSTDDYFLDPSLWTSDYIVSKNTYVWAKDLFPSNVNVTDWSAPYQEIYYANTILQALPGVARSTADQSTADRIKGSALFFRSIAFYNLLQLFAAAYDATTAGTDPGIPMPLVPDLTAKLPRAAQADCYRQIIADCNTALPLLPDLPSLKTRPSKAAVYGLFSRMYLIMGNYSMSLLYSEKFLKLYNQLQDFNKLSPAAFPVYPNFSPEEVFHAAFVGYSGLSFHAQVDPGLYQLFNDPNDLRRTIFFTTRAGIRTFNSQFDKHNAIAYTIFTNEIYLNKAECEARLNDPASALADLNTLLSARWKTGTFQPITAGTATEALALVLRERRKELVMTGIRWTDLRRLNKDPALAVTLIRNINGTAYSLPPNDSRYTLPIPQNELNLNPLPQNPR